jgi:rhodanese-related sulfurtransferase
MPSVWSIAAAALLAIAAFAASAADKPVNITADLPAVEVKHEGRTVRIERNPDNLNQIDADFALTSRPCPPYCVQPMQIAPGVETIGELEVLDYLRRMSAGDGGIMLIDSREKEWLQRSGVIPGAVSIPWNELHPAQAEPGAIADILELRFGATRSGNLWNFATARTLVLYCNGIWCGQSPTNIRQLLSLGYPAHKLKWYRGGMQSWKALGLTTVELKPLAKPPAPK